MVHTMLTVAAHADCGKSSTLDPKSISCADSQHALQQQQMAHNKVTHALLGCKNLMRGCCQHAAALKHLYMKGLV